MLRRLQLVFFLVLGFTLLPHAEVTHRADKGKIVLHDNEWLQRWYDSDNEIYFQNQLPRVPVTWANLGKDKEGRFIMGDTAEIDGGIAVYIRIDRYSNVTASEVLLTLRHEECHAKVDPRLPADADPHGDEFQKCMIGLADAGAFKGAW